MPAQITGVHENVPVRNNELPVIGVRIGNRNNPHNPTVLTLTPALG